VVIFVLSVAEVQLQHLIVVLKPAHKQSTAGTETLHDSVDCERCWTRVNLPLKSHVRRNTYTTLPGRLVQYSTAMCCIAYLTLLYLFLLTTVF